MLCFGFSWFGWFLFRLDWNGLDMFGLDWIGLAWTCLDWIGLDWLGHVWIALDRIGLIGLNCLDLVFFRRGMGRQYDMLSSGFQVAGRKERGGEAGVSGGN